MVGAGLGEILLRVVQGWVCHVGTVEKSQSGRGLRTLAGCWPGRLSWVGVKGRKGRAEGSEGSQGADGPEEESLPARGGEVLGTAWSPSRGRKLGGKEQAPEGQRDNAGG